LWQLLAGARDFKKSKTWNLKNNQILE
jgi:hypothetical protein